MNHIDKYILSPLPVGSGLYATVYKAYDVENSRIVAIKNTTNIKRACREVEVMKAYGSHKYLPTLYDFFLYKDAAYIVMEYINGKSLGIDFRTKSKTQLNEKQSLSIVLKMLKALQTLHDSGYAHMDTKPGNVIISTEAIKVIDFNTSKPVTKKLVQVDIRNAAKMFVFLTNGFIPRPIEKANFADNRIRSVIFESVSPLRRHGYHTAMEFYSALKR